MSLDYQVDMLARVIPFAFDPDRSWGFEVSNVRIDPEMPRAQSDPSSANSLWAVAADVQRAFMVLPLDEAVVLWLSYGLQLSRKVVATRTGLSDWRVRALRDDGLDRMKRFLEGDRTVKAPVTWFEWVHGWLSANGMLVARPAV